AACAPRRAPGGAHRACARVLPRRRRACGRSGRAGGRTARDPASVRFALDARRRDVADACRAPVVDLGARAAAGRKAVPGRVGARMKVDVCIATFRRPEWLALLLDDLAQQRLEGEVALRLIVVDNDAAGSAQAVAQAYRGVPPLLYLSQPKKNIALTR